MKITNKNVGYYISLVTILFLLLCPVLFGCNRFTMGCFVSGLIFIVCLVILEIIKFLVDCDLDNIKFEFDIDLLKPFRTRHIPPEEEDKQNK